MRRANLVQQAYREACALDILALKPGNVSQYSAGHGMTSEDFRRSVELTAPLICQPGKSMGDIIKACAEVTIDGVGCNTNLGIILLCVPIAQAAYACETGGELQSGVSLLIEAADINDTQAIFDAISLMSPAGLGTSELHDVRRRADAELLQVMQVSASRDRIAWQFAHNFEDIFIVGKRSFLRSFAERRCEHGNELENAATAVFLDFLCAYPDSHIARKHGACMADVVRDEARIKREVYYSLEPGESRQNILLAFDSDLKIRGINPGTSADLTVATLFLSLLSLWW